MTAEFQVYGGAVSTNGGRTWWPFEAPGLTHCTGGPADASDDPGVSFGRSGTAFLSTQANDPLPEAILVSRSADDGLSWSAPIVVDRANTNDKQRSPVAVDPANPSHAYLTWTRLRGPEAADVYFSSSTDAGSTWTPPTPAYITVGADLRPLHNLIHVLPGHVLLDTFVQLNTSNDVAGLPRQRDQLIAIRSVDGGTTWSSSQIGTTSDMAPEDPATGKPVSAEPVLYSDVGPDGSVYAAWNDIASTSSSRIMLSRSSDGGQSWSSPVAVASVNGQAFLPALAVDPEGTVGVSWYDTRRYRPGDRQLSTDVWFADSTDQGGHWHQVHVAGPFDLRTAYYRPGAAGAASGYFLGDYDGLTALPDGFGAVFAAPKPLARFGMSNIFFDHIRLNSPTPGCPRATGTLAGKRLGLVALGMTRAQARRAYARSSDRGKRYEDFFCLTPIGVRVGYASPKLLRTLPRRERGRFRGRVVWASTSNPFYTLRGVRPGSTLAAARRHLRLTGPYHIGLNYWYLASNVASTAVLKERHGIVEEIGIAYKSLTKDHKAQLIFLKSFF